jgi:sialate O-acetylesterase
LKASDPGYADFSCDDTQWQQINQKNWMWRGIGSVWLRQHIHIDKEHAGKPARLLLGTLFDQDITYLNGKEIGHTYYQYPPRRYNIPAGVLREGDNVIAVRIIVKSGMANFFKDKPHEIVFDEDKTTVPLSLDWKIKTGSLMPEGPLGGKINTNNQASVLYNGMISPLAPYAIKGVVWYQGESNTGKPMEYGGMLTKMMGNWRSIFGNPMLPFNIVQLAGYMDYSEKPQDSTWSQLREQQRLSAKDDAYATITCAHDLGEASDIHPLRKREVAERCAMALLKGILSPQPVRMEKRGDSTVVIMDQQLQDNDGTGDMEIFSNGKWQNVKGKAHGTEIVINAIGEKVRYAWKSNPINATLMGKNGLPVVPFEL